jgi:predicted transcriptional regulator
MVCDAANPRMLVAVGHPAAAMAVPVYVKAKQAIPQCVGGNAMLELGNEFRSKVYKNITKGEDELDKATIRKVVAIETKCEMPSLLPQNIAKFNAKIDKQFAKHAKKVRKVLK